MSTTVAEIRPNTIRQAPSVAFEHQCRMAEAFARSGLFGVKTADQALALMALCEAEGLHPAIAVRDYHIIQGKPALKADAMMARFQNAGGRVKWLAMTDERVAGEFSHPAGGTVEIDWDKKRAETAGFWGKENWKKFPRAMLRARVISEGIRSVFPGVVVGTYTPEEVQDFEPAKPEPSKITPTGGAWESMDEDEQGFLMSIADRCFPLLDAGDAAGVVALIKAEKLTADEQIALWTRFDSKQRSAMKKAAKAAEAPKEQEAQ
jgi:hypothetical protein